MQIVVINLASEQARWLAADRQFRALGLEPTRQEAIEGSLLSAAERAALYSESLNRAQYHKPLRPGEIGCYASHVAAWQRLLRSGEAVMAVFEDDVEIDADLPRVLDAVARLRLPWDVVKLIGREHEKVRERRPLLERRELIAYRRVPSLTGAYVVTAAGARKLLAHRLPFGRPIDVDMRHWWECDLDVLGVWPYPVRGAPSSRVSTIEDRRTHAGALARIRKLALQARYSFMNAMALQVRDSRSAAAQRDHGTPVGERPAGQDVV
jgi:glycosyl transferase, family 25